MTILLDTKVVAEALRKRPHPRVIAWLNEQVWDTVYICAPTVGELLRALGKLPECQHIRRWPLARQSAKRRGNVIFLEG